jgi:hypothetical protein
MLRAKEQSAPPLRVLLYDLETSPNLGYTWGKWEQDVIQFVEERKIISVAWKWLGNADVHVRALPDFPNYKKDPKDNKALVCHLHSLMEQADVTVGHNVIDFDDKISNMEFVRHGLKPAPPHKQVDTLKVARTYFAFNSNKLDDLGAVLGLGRKVKHPGIELWLGCLHGDLASWALMKKYNKGDVVLLEKIYLKFRPWMLKHPNLNPLDRAAFSCPYCRSARLTHRGWSITTGGRKQRFQCQECGKWAVASWVKKQLRIS